MKIKLLIIALALAFVGANAYSQCKGKCRNGKGVFTFEDGEVYDGTFVEGKFDGKGTYTYPTGDIYTGDFVEGLPEGKGIYTFATGDRYEGEFKTGKRNGKGVYIFASGTKQTGIFENSILIEEISIERQKKN